MTYDAQESTLRRAAEYGILALKSRANEIRIQAQRAMKDGNEGFAAAMVKNAQDIDADVAEMEMAYRLKYPKVSA